MARANPYVAVYNGLGGYQVMYGASNSHAKAYKKLLHMMAHRIRLKKHLMRARGSKAAKLKSQIKMLNASIARLKSKLAQNGQPAPSENEAAAAEQITGSTFASSGSGAVTGSSYLRPKRRSRSHRGMVRGLRSQRYAHHKRKARRLHPAMNPDAIRAGGGTFEVAVQHPQLTGEVPSWIHARNPHRARLPGQRQFDGRRRQGPISASDVQSEDVSQDAPDMTGDDDMAMATTSPDMIDSVSEAVDEGLSGIMDFASGLWDNKPKLLLYGALGFGLWKMFGGRRRR